MAMTPHIPLLSWEPDGDPTIPGTISDVSNLLPTQRGYAPDFELGVVPGSQFSAGTLPSQCMGAGYCRFSSNTPVTLLASEDDLFVSWGGTLTNLSRTASAYTAASRSHPWRFAAYDNVALAVQNDNILQATGAPAGGTEFADVTDAPKGNSICTQAGFVLISGDTTSLNTWYCSARYDYTDWTLDVATQCAQGDLTQTPGGIVRLLAHRNYVIAFKAGSMLRGTYIGAPIVWRWDVISTSVGLAGHDAVVEADGVLYWLSDDGFYSFDGSAVRRVRGPWDFLRRSMGSETTVYLNLVQAQWDRQRRVVRWYYPSDYLAPYVLDGGLAFHPDTGRWGRFSCDAEWVTYSLSEPTRSHLTGNLQSVNDAPVVIDSTLHRINLFCGSAQNSTLTTGDVGDDDAVNVMIRARTRFLVKPTLADMTHSHRMNLGDDLVAGQTVSRSDGKYDFSHGARWHRLQFVQAGRHEMVGLRVDAIGAGKR